MFVAQVEAEEEESVEWLLEKLETTKSWASVLMYEEQHKGTIFVECHRRLPRAVSICTRSVCVAINSSGGLCDVCTQCLGGEIWNMMRGVACR